MHWIDSNCLPETQGVVEGFITNPQGAVDGVVLVGATQARLLVCTPPHLGAAIEAAVKTGDTISVRGVRPRQADVVAAVALTVGNGRTITDNGPPDEDEAPGPGGKPSAMEAEGPVRLALFGPKGELRGALLEDGTVIRIGAKEAKAHACLLRPGAPIAVRGEGRQTNHGRVIAVEAIGPDRHSLKPAKTLKREDSAKDADKPKHKKPHGGEPAHADAPGA